MNAAWTVRIVGWLPLPTLGILACTVPPRAPVSRTEQQVPPGEHRTPAAPRNEPGHLHQEAAPNLPELASPDIVLPADRLHERVDGAATLLQTLGCHKLSYWRVETPPADLEVLEFDSPAGARAALDRDSGGDRTAEGPGEERWGNEQCVFFCRGGVYVRLIADDLEHSAALRRLSEQIDRAIVAGSHR